MQVLFKQRRFFNLARALSLALLCLGIAVVAAFGMTAMQKQTVQVAIVTTEGDASVLENITLEGVIWKEGYQASFSITGQQVKTQVKTLETEGLWTWNSWGNIPDAFQNEISRTGYLIEENNLCYLLAEHASQTLLYRTQETDLNIWQDDAEITVYDLTYSADLAVPAFCFLDAATVDWYGYAYGNNDIILADYTIAAGQDGWEMTYHQTEYEYPGAVDAFDSPRWDTIPSIAAPTCTNYLQLSASIGGEDYITLPTLAGAVGENGIYRKTPTDASTYIWSNEVADLSDATVKTDFEAQREAVYRYDIQTGDEADRITCGMIAHKDTLFLLTAQIEAAQTTTQDNQTTGVQDATQTTLTLTVIDPVTGEVLDSIALGSYALQADCPPMLYQNDDYLSVGIAIASGVGSADAAGYTVLSFAFAPEADASAAAEQNQEIQSDMRSETGMLQLCDATTFAGNLWADSSCLQDVYFDGATLFLMESSTCDADNTSAVRTQYSTDGLDGTMYQRMMAFQGGACVWQGYLSTDIYQDYLCSDQNVSSARVVSNLKFHQEGEVQP